jgi:hypothetical protein
MGHGDVIRKHLTGTSIEEPRRQELLEALLDRFAEGGAEAVASELKDRIDALERTFDGELQALNALLS